MPWNYDDAQINGIIDSNLKDSPPNPAQVNTASLVRALLKAMWVAIRGQVSTAVTSIDAVQASFVSRSLNLNAVVYVRADVGDDSRTGETNNATGATGAVKTLARAIQLHSGKTRKLTIEIVSGTVEVASDMSIDIPELAIQVVNGATLRFRKRTAMKDTNNVTVGEGNYRLLCYSAVLNVRNDGILDVEAHTGSTGAGDQYYYKLGQGAMAICTSGSQVTGVAFQAISYFGYGSATVGANATLFTYGTAGGNFYGSNRARYQRSPFSIGITLGTNAVESALETDRLFETLVYEGSGSSKSVNIRRSYAFAFEIVYNDGCTITVQPAGNCSANANNTLTFNGAVGKTVTVRLTSNIIL